MYPQLDRRKLVFRPLSERVNRVDIERAQVDPDTAPPPIDRAAEAILDEIVERIRAAVRTERPVVLAFGAHTIKNGLGPVLIALMENRLVSHLATNGAGIIHDWEFSYLGASSEHVAANVADGSFGNWDETGRYINLALAVGALEGRGYGESVGALIERGVLSIPSADALASRIRETVDRDPETAAAAADLLAVIRDQDLPEGSLEVLHRWKRYSAQAAAFRLGIPFTGHPMIGHDIIYNHPANHGGAVGRTALRDFLAFAQSISRIDGGVYLSIGSAVMSPMIFEKSLSMAQNLAAQQGHRITGHMIGVVDLAASDWDWNHGEPPESHPSYYLRFNKSFSRMGGHMRYLQMDNRTFLLHIWRRLKEDPPA